MYLKRLLALLCSLALVFCLVPSTAFASGGNGNIDGGGGGMGQGTSSNFWNPGNDGVRITVVDAASGAAVSSPLDFSNRTQKSSILHFGKVNKLQYLSGTGLSLQSGVAYSCIKPAQSMPTIVSSKGQSNIDAIKRYFCSEYACMMVAQAAGVDHLIHFQQRPVHKLRHPKKYGFVITNPPYGERMEDKEDMPILYREIGEAFSHLDGWSEYIITAYEDAERYIGKKADKNRKIYNGMMKTYFYQFLGPKPPRRKPTDAKSGQ